MLPLVLLSMTNGWIDRQGLSPWWTQELASESLLIPEAVVGRISGPWRRETRVLLNSTGYTPRRFSPNPAAWPCIANEVKLGGSGATLTVVIPEYGERLTSSMSGQVLVFCQRPLKENDGSRIIEFGFGRAGSRTLMRFVSKQPNEVGGLLILPTRGTAETPGASLDDRLEAILDTVDPSDSTSYRRVARLLCRAHPKWTLHPNPLYVDSGDRAIRSMIEAADNPRLAATLLRLRSEVKNEYQRSHLLALQIRWGIPGALNDYRDSIIRLLKDPIAYVGAAEGDHIWGPVDFSAYPSLSLESLKGTYSFESWCKDLESARNPVLRNYWLMNAVGVSFPAPHQMARFARLLLVHDQEFQYYVMVRLSNWTATPDKMPDKDGVVNGELIMYPRFDELMNYWKGRFGIRS